MEDKSVSCYSSRLLINYATKKGIDVISFLIHVDTPYHELMDPKCWMSVFDWVKLAKYVSVYTEKTIEQMSYEIVKDLKGQLTFRLWMLSLVPIYLIKKLNLMNWIVSNYVNTNHYVYIESTTSNSFIINFAIKNRILYSKELCDYNKGCARALAEIRGWDQVVVNELSCAADYVACDSCRYEVTMNRHNREKGNIFRKNAYENIQKEDLDPTLKQCLLTEKEIDVLFGKGEKNERL